MTDYAEEDLRLLGEAIMKCLASFDVDHEFTLYEFQAAIDPLHEDPRCGYALKSLEEEMFIELYYINQQPLIRLTLNGYEFAQSLGDLGK